MISALVSGFFGRGAETRKAGSNQPFSVGMEERGEREVTVVGCCNSSCVSVCLSASPSLFFFHVL